MRAKSMPYRYLSLTAFFLVLAAACSPLAAGSERLDSTTPTSTSTSLPPTATATPSASPTATTTSTPTPHPLEIDFLRSRDYPGGEITIEETLASGVNYHRYVASYPSDELKIFALLTIPFGEPPDTGWPSVVFNHGYIPPDQYRTTERYVNYVDGFARSGYIVFRSDYRGHDNSEGIASSAYGSPAYTIDVLNAVSAVKRLEVADPDRVGMWGHSMGGYITLRSMVTNDDIKAGVIWAGVVGSYPDLIERWTRRRGAGVATPTPRPNSWRRPIYLIYGTPGENPEFWNSISANAYLDELSGPVQLHHGTADPTVPVEFSRNLYEQVLEAGGTAELYEYPEDDHNISNYFTLAMQRSVRFFDEHVKGAG